MVAIVDIISTQADAQRLLAQLEYAGGGGANGSSVSQPDSSNERILPRTAYAKQARNEFISYQRFLEEAVTGYSSLSRRNESNQRIILPRFVKGRIASASPEHSLCRVGGDGQHCGAGGSGVASWGVGRRGQLGHGKRRDEREPRRLLELGYKTRIIQVAAGGGLVRVAHSLLLTSTGRVLSFGTGQYGALGHGYSAAKQLPDVLRPMYIRALEGVISVCVAAGELHSSVVTSDGDVYTWGDGFCGQLGHGDKRPQVLPKQVTMGGLDEECVASVSCGSRHTVVVLEDGQVYTWGLGHYGVLGRSYTPFEYDADMALEGQGDAVIVANREEGSNHFIQDAESAAESHHTELSAEIMAHIDLIANLTLDDSSDQCIPMLVDALKDIRIIGASAGHRHTLFLDDDGFLYSCGAGSSGCLGHGDSLSQMYPLRISSLIDDHVRIRQMSAGVDCSMAVSTRGHVYGWGRTDGGRIGLGLDRGVIPTPLRVRVVDEQGQDLAAVDVECGYVHSLIIGVNGTIHECGKVGVEGEDDGQSSETEEPMKNHSSSEGCETSKEFGTARQRPNLCVWHRLAEPKDEVLKPEKWKKYGKYEIKGRSTMMKNETK